MKLHWFAQHIVYLTGGQVLNPDSLLNWRCGLAGAIPPIAPPRQNPQFRYVRCSRYIWVLRNCEMNMVIGQVPFLRSFRSIFKVKKKDVVNIPYQYQ